MKKYRWQILSVDAENQLSTSICGEFADMKKALKYAADVLAGEDERNDTKSEIISIIRLAD